MTTVTPEPTARFTAMANVYWQRLAPLMSTDKSNDWSEEATQLEAAIGARDEDELARVLGFVSEYMSADKSNDWASELEEVEAAMTGAPFQRPAAVKAIALVRYIWVCGQCSTADRNQYTDPRGLTLVCSHCGTDNMIQEAP